MKRPPHSSSPFTPSPQPPPQTHTIHQALWMLPIFLLAFVVSLGLNDGVAEAGKLFK
jgi:hypothetical protein